MLKEIEYKQTWIRMTLKKIDYEDNIKYEWHWNTVYQRDLNPNGFKEIDYE